MDASAIKEIVALAIKAATPQQPEGIAAPFVIDREGHAYSLEGLMNHPTRKRGIVIFKKWQSLADYARDHIDEESSKFYVNSNTEMGIVFNDHTEEVPGFRDHRASLVLDVSPEWKTWLESNGKTKGHQDFAKFIEDNMDDVVQPVGGALLDLIRNFRATQTAEFQAAITDNDGNSTLQYVKTLKTGAGPKGDLELPKEFVLSLSPYEGGVEMPITARLNFKIDCGKLFLWFELVKIERKMREARDEIVTLVNKATGLTPLYGTP